MAQTARPPPGEPTPQHRPLSAREKREKWEQQQDHIDRLMETPVLRGDVLETFNKPPPRTLNKEQVEQQVHRLYTQHFELKPKKQANLARKHFAEKEYPVKPLSEAKIQEQLERLINLPKTKQAQIHKRLNLKYAEEKDHPKLKSTEQEGELQNRLIDLPALKKREGAKKLDKKYAFERKPYTGRDFPTHNHAQWDATVARLTRVSQKWKKK
eukprot:TRINITY_DN67791_c8_g4_i1.p1 TRINITY_DN67791_c8_g4~~TRINITY_DN67791_c8_g4_i1.p1  ORF type:complete len:212 (-),score=27.83 TRINITY_DN67791_c8_g4_i1:595-1230(-)